MRNFEVAIPPEYENILRRIRRSKKLSSYTKVSFWFAVYLSETKNKYLNLYGFDTFTCRSVIAQVPYIHRFTDLYVSSIYAKFSRLQDWYKANPMPVYMMTLTLSHRDVTIPEAFRILREGWRALTANLRAFRRDDGTLEYIYVYEPHKSGYPHMHVILFSDCLSDRDFERLRKLWADKLVEQASYEHGLNIVKPRSYNDVEYLRAYLLKYIQKSFDFENITPSTFVYLACLWDFYDRSKWSQKLCVPKKNGGYRAVSTGGGAFRFWGASRALTAVMKYESKEIDATRNFVNYQRFGEEEIPEVVVRLAHKSLTSFLSEKDGKF